MRYCLRFLSFLMVSKAALETRFRAIPVPFALLPSFICGTDSPYSVI